MLSIVVGHGVALELKGGRSLFSSLSFSLPLRRVGLVGPNGVGKTSFARLLAGELAPTSGTLKRSGAFTFLRQREIPPAAPVAEWIGADFDWAGPGARLLEEIPLETSCANLSGGQWMLVRLARALGEGFLLLDEPTNDLDGEGRRAVLQFLRSHEGGALLISHDRECLALCEEIWELSSQGLQVYGGGWAAYEEEKERERAGLASALDRAKRERDAAARERTEKLARQEKRNRRGAAEAARGGIPRIIAGGNKRRAEATLGKVDSTSLEQANGAAAEAWAAFRAMKTDPVMYAELSGAPLPEQKLVAEAQGFNVRHAEWVFRENLTFGWRGNIRVALRGKNGAGKSTLLRALRGEELSCRGSLRLGSLRTLYLDQRCAILNDEQTVLENVQASSEASESELRNGLAKLLFAKDMVFQRAGSLSGGERLRAALAKGLLAKEKPELLILDEPTNNLDLANIRFLENLVREFRGALLVISHDPVFLENCGIEEFVDL